MLHPREVGMCVSRKYLYPSHGRSWEILRKAGRRGGGERGFKQKTFRAGGMDVLWNHTISCLISYVKALSEFL